MTHDGDGDPCHCSTTGHGRAPICTEDPTGAAPTRGNPTSSSADDGALKLDVYANGRLAPLFGIMIGSAVDDVGVTRRLLVAKAQNGRILIAKRTVAIRQPVLRMDATVV